MPKKHWRISPESVSYTLSDNVPLKPVSFCNDLAKGIILLEEMYWSDETSLVTA